MTEKRKYDSTVARIAGNIVSAMHVEFNPDDPDFYENVAREAVQMARAIITEVIRTEPEPKP